MKTEHGFDQLIPLDVFNDASNGYLMDDCCVFGAEVFVLEGSSKGECASLKELGNNSYTWKIENFEEMEEKIRNSEAFVIGGHRWKLQLDPNGSEKEHGKSVSLFLKLDDEEPLDPAHSLCVDYVMRVRDQVNGKHHERFGGSSFALSGDSWGYLKLITLSKLNDKSQGYMVNGSVILEVQISLITKIKEFS
ncbi:TRAF-like family protein [Euphorbia peplus]|nr:TRAF-like family protein [Euphorbia peplus]